MGAADGLHAALMHAGMTAEQATEVVVAIEALIAEPAPASVAATTATAKKKSKKKKKR